MKGFMKNLWVITLLILILASPLLSLAKPSKEESGISSGAEVQSERIARMESRIVDQVNQIRAENQLNKLDTSPGMTLVARDYARRMVIEDFFSHYDPSGDSVAVRVKDAGIDYRMVGENIFGSYNLDDPGEAAVNKWMQSQGHRENILTPEFTQTGVGIWKEKNRYRIVQIFLKPAE